MDEGVLKLIYYKNNNIEEDDTFRKTGRRIRK